MKKTKNVLTFICLLFFSTLLLNACSKDEEEPEEPGPKKEEYGATATIEVENGETFQFSTTKDEKGEMMAAFTTIDNDKEGSIIVLADANSETQIFILGSHIRTTGTYTFNLSGETPLGSVVALNSMEPVTLVSFDPGFEYPEYVYLSNIPNEKGFVTGTGTLTITDYTEDTVKGTFSMTLYNKTGAKTSIKNGSFYCPIKILDE